MRQNNVNKYHRLYQNGDIAIIIAVTDAELEHYVEYNKKRRPDCAQFVNNVCVYPGYVSQEKLAEHQATLNDKMIEYAVHFHFKPDTNKMGKCVEFLKAESPEMAQSRFLKSALPEMKIDSITERKNSGRTTIKI